MTRTIASLLSLAALSTLVLTAALPSTFTTAVIACQVLTLLLLLTPDMRANIDRRPAIALPLVAAALLTLAFAMTARSTLSVIGAIIFAPMYLTGPLIAAFRRSGTVVTAERVSALALIGATGAALVALYDRFVLGTDRAGELVTNPIHFSDACLALGLIGLIGLFSRRERRWLGLAAPAMALVPIVLSQTRGTMIALVPVVLMALILAAAWYRLPARVWTLIGTGLLAVVALLAALYLSEWQPLMRATSTLGALASGQAVTDSSDGPRLVMLRAAWHALSNAPLFGIGVVDFGARALAALPQSGAPISAEHLHNDIADFATVGGVFGIAAYGLIIATPIVDIVRAPRSDRRRNALFVAILLAIAYIAMGLTNAVMGILLLTTFYALATVLLSLMAREPETAAASAVRAAS